MAPFSQPRFDTSPEEVTDPNAVRADAQDAESDAAIDGSGRPVRYTHPNSLVAFPVILFMVNSWVIHG